MADYGIYPARLAQLLAYDPATGQLTWLPRPFDEFTSLRIARSWNAKLAGKPAFTAQSHGYFVGRCSGRNIPAHRAAWCLHYGEWPQHEIDHISGNKGDNRIVNLRAVPHRENGRNVRRPTNNTSGQIGVSQRSDNGRWHAYIGDPKQGERLNIGYFGTRREAIAARQQVQAEIGYHANHGRNAA